MPWTETCVMDERVRFIGRVMDGEKIVDLCREFGISRKTAYKFLERYEKFGVDGLLDRSRRPIFSPGKTSDEIERHIIKLKSIQPSWGPKKLKAKLEQKYPGVQFPAASTMGAILHKHGLVQVSKRRRRLEERFYPTEIRQSKVPNEVWCVDFKGQFKLGNGRYCYPLTVTDHFSRYLLGCDALTSTSTTPAMDSFEAIFDEFGLPDAIRSDNGVPFSTPRGLGGLSELSVWWMRLGIQPERIEPGCPQQNGRHERFHLTLKNETTRPAKANLLQQQERFDLFRDEYNNERPHEALNMKTPSTKYKKSRRKLADAMKELDYPLHDFTVKVGSTGAVRLPGGKQCKIASFFTGHTLGLRELEEEVLLVSFGQFDLGYIEQKTGKFLLDNPLSEEDAL
jgi:transposase InsO family protein